MKHLLCFLSIALLFVSCGRSADDDTVWVCLSIQNKAATKIYVETNFPTSITSQAVPCEGVLAFRQSISIFGYDIMRRVRTYEDFLPQILSYYPDAEVSIYSVNEDQTKGELLLSCSLSEIPADVWGWEYTHIHFYNPNEYPWALHLGFAWNGKELTNGL
ncbi:MAG: hypothetical protein J5695_05590 [Bacteroidales bacterium]|nr:hypothetical protein [Bacteroidales bacterium]